MDTRCKFKCTSKTERTWGSPKTVFEYVFSIVYGDSEENKRFFAATPSGELKIGVVRDGTFEVGKEYYLDIIGVE